MNSHHPSMDHRKGEPVFELAHRYGLDLSGPLDINELGLDFQVVTATDGAGVPWVLRIPRRPEVIKKIEREAKILAFLEPRLQFAVPDWRIVSDELVAYPRLNDPTAIHFDVATNELTWNMDKDSDAYVTTLGKSLAALHQVSIEEAVDSGLKSSTSREMRDQIACDIEHVKNAFDIDPQLERRWRTWLDNAPLWPHHSVVVHGDLYAGHVLVNQKSEVTGIIDWTEAEVSDPSIDFTSHLLLFGEAGLDDLIRSYETAGGKVWPNMVSHIAERLVAAPIKYALFALESGDPVHLDAVKVQLRPT